MTRWSWRDAPQLMDRLIAAQNNPRNDNRDIVTFAGFCDSEAELLRHIEHNEATLAEETV